MPFLAAAIPAIVGGLSAAAPIMSSVGTVLGAAAPLINGFTGASSQAAAANAQVSAGNSAIEDWNKAMEAQRGNMAPFLSLGQTSAGSLMDMLKNGTLGPGSLGPVPTAPGAFTGEFHTPTAEEARNTPGYQFTQQEGNKGILEGSAAAGGAISGGTFKALDKFNTGLADTTYNDVFNRSMQQYQSSLQGYQANLAGYGQQLAGFQTGMAAQNQGFNQLFAPTQLGTNAAGSLNSNINSGAISISDLMTQVGNAQANGILGKNAGMATGLSGLPNLLTTISGMMPKRGGGAQDVFQPISPAGPVYPWQLGGAGTPPILPPG